MAEAKSLLQAWVSDAQKAEFKALCRRRAALGLDASASETIRAAITLAASASDEDLKKGEL